MQSSLLWQGAKEIISPMETIDNDASLYDLIETPNYVTVYVQRKSDIVELLNVILLDSKRKIVKSI